MNKQIDGLKAALLRTQAELLLLKDKVNEQGIEIESIKKSIDSPPAS